MPQCINCVISYCSKKERARKGIKEWKINQLPEFCPMKYKKEIIEKAQLKYEEKEAKKLYLNSVIIERNTDQIIRGRRIGVRPRILEIIKFSELMDWKKIGLAYCSGLTNEAKRVGEIFENAGFELYSIRCTCDADNIQLGTPKKYNVTYLLREPERFEAVCNPIVQAELLNSESLDLHIIIGLCIGHDIQFTKYSKAPVSTLIVKDRVTGNNPSASLFSSFHHPRYWKEE